MDVASPIESRIAGEQIASGTRFTFTARKPITLATRFARDWHEPGFVPVPHGRSDSTNGARNEPRARYRRPHPPSATGEGQAS